LAFLDSKLNNLMFSLYRTRQAVIVMKEGALSAQMHGHVAEALASLREQERTLADIQQRITSVRRGPDRL
jgi:hypothetical protein